MRRYAGVIDVGAVPPDGYWPTQSAEFTTAGGVPSICWDYPFYAPFGQTKLTYALWVKILTAPTGVGAQLYTSNTNGWSVTAGGHGLIVEPDLRLTTAYQGDPLNPLDRELWRTTNPISLNTWYLVTGLWDTTGAAGSRCGLFLNGYAGVGGNVLTAISTPALTGKMGIGQQAQDPPVAGDGKLIGRVCGTIGEYGTLWSAAEILAYYTNAYRPARTMSFDIPCDQIAGGDPSLLLDLGSFGRNWWTSGRYTFSADKPH